MTLLHTCSAHNNYLLEISNIDTYFSLCKKIKQTFKNEKSESNQEYTYSETATDSLTPLITKVIQQTLASIILFTTMINVS